MEKLLQRIQTPPIYPIGQHSPPSTQPSGQKPLHAPPLSGAWAYASPSVNLTAHPIRFYASSPVQPSHPSGHPPPHAPPITAGQQPSKLSNLYSSTNLSVDPLQQPFFYRNGADQHHNRSGIEAGESSAPSNYGQPYVRGLGINQTYRRTVFEVSTSLAQTDLPMYSKNPIISLHNVPSNYITNSVAFSAQSLTHDNGKPILVCEYCKKQRHTKDQCWKLHGQPPRGNKCSSNEQQNLRHRETASTSQPIGLTASQTSSPALNAITQPGISQSLGLISVDGTNLWILDSGATDHLTSFLEHFVTYTRYAGNEKIRIANGSLAPITRELHCKATFLLESVCFQDLKSGRTIGTARHRRGLYILNDDTSGHPNFTYMKYLFPHLFLKIDVSSLSCDVCIRAKQHRVSFHSQPYKPTQPFTLIHSDVWGPSKVTTSSGKRDNGREFQNHNLSEFLASKGIVHQNSCAYTPQQNGVAERKNRHLLEVARSLMLSTSLPSYLWGDAILTAAHLINRMPSRILHLQTPLECLKESYPSTRHVSKVTKFTPRAQACVFVGYPPHQRGYKCFHPPSRKYFVTMDVTFCEDRPYFSLTQESFP
ncbi:Beta-galactosidase [Cucumis melo var. makuwa]|uniref:Beta-galactosidase n=1 Tax=Cucumis melo var. makuwa TaxID=1194695 RepID=A0A5D3BD51_CUCMM|nr:Beta-galactosidase [Cucumis melo var. makuwa]